MNLNFVKIASTQKSKNLKLFFKFLIRIISRQQLNIQIKKSKIKIGGSTSGQFVLLNHLKQGLGKLKVLNILII